MVRPGKRTRSNKRVTKRTPGGRVTIHYRAEKAGVTRCATCGKPLVGTPRISTSEFNKISKSKKRPTRPFGGYLCSPCTRAEIKKRARS